MAFPRIFAALSGVIPASYLDENFSAAAEAATVTALQTQVNALAGSATPLAHVAAGAAGASTQFSRVDHRHPPPPATGFTGTAGAKVANYTLVAADDGKVIEFDAAAEVTCTIPNSLAAGFSCSIVQVGAGKVVVAPGASATRRQRLAYTRTAGQWAVVSMYVRQNVGGTAAEFVLGGDMVA